MTNSDRPNIDNFLMGRTKNTLNLVVTFCIFWSFSTIATKFWPDFGEFHEKRKKTHIFCQNFVIFWKFLNFKFWKFEILSFFDSKNAKIWCFLRKNTQNDIFCVFQDYRPFRACKFHEKSENERFWPFFDHFLIFSYMVFYVFFNASYFYEGSV